MEYNDFFHKITGFEPFPWQQKLVEGAWPQLLDIPTGLGKTAGVVVAWLYRRMRYPEEAHRRLVYCLPTRALVEQTLENARAWLEQFEAIYTGPEAAIPLCHPYLGGDAESDWIGSPARPSIIVGTQDLLLSAALNRGYTISRFVWPMAFGLLHNDAMWVFDETQLMGPALPNSAQLQGLREQFGTYAPTRSLWMSATLDEKELHTYAHNRPADGFRKLILSEEEKTHPIVRKRISARKELHIADTVLDSITKKDIKNYAKTLAEEVLSEHIDGSTTLVIVNTVARAQAIYRSLSESDHECVLLHSRFREIERKAAFEALSEEGDAIVVTTQVMEAGVDFSAVTLFTETAPLASIIQRAGRCNRYGETNNARVFLINIQSKSHGKEALPYDVDEVEAAFRTLDHIDDVGPASLGGLDRGSSKNVYSHLRQKDLLALFHNDSALLGDDIDISRWIRDGEDTDVSVYWRRLEGIPNKKERKPKREELCRVSIGAFKKYVKRLNKKKKKTSEEILPPSVWHWDYVRGRWDKVLPNDIVPGRTYLATSNAAGYDPALGWTGDMPKKKTPEVPLLEREEQQDNRDQMSQNGDQESEIGQWISLGEHLDDVEEACRSLTQSLDMAKDEVELFADAARWHDVGKVHPVFQNMLKSGYESPPEYPVAKSPDYRSGGPERPGFRHELASLLGYQASVREQNPLTAFLILSHHGKIRTQIRSMPGELKPESSILYARGVWDGDTLEPIESKPELLGETTTLSLDVMRIGESSWVHTIIHLLDEYGPFVLGFFEAVFRAADWRASAMESQSGGLADES